MKRYQYFVMTLCIFEMALSPSHAAAQTGRESKPPVLRDCSQVVDRAFQFASGGAGEYRYFDLRIVLRFLPAYDFPEAQFVIHRKRDGAFRVIEYKLKPGSAPISAKCDEVLRVNPSASVDDVVAQLGVQRIERVPSPSMIQLLNEFDRLSIPAKLNTDLTLDGTTYRIWIQTMSNEIYASFSDGAYANETDSIPILRWMKAVRAEAQK